MKKLFKRVNKRFNSNLYPFINLLLLLSIKIKAIFSIVLSDMKRLFKYANKLFTLTLFSLLFMLSWVLHFLNLKDMRSQVNLLQSGQNSISPKNKVRFNLDIFVGVTLE